MMPKVSTWQATKKTAKSIHIFDPPHGTVGVEARAILVNERLLDRVRRFGPALHLANWQAAKMILVQAQTVPKMMLLWHPEQRRTRSASETLQRRPRVK